MIIAAIVAAVCTSEERSWNKERISRNQKRQTKDESISTRVYNNSSKGAMEPIDSTKDVSSSSSVPLKISDSKVLDCYNCFQPLRIPVFQCDNGHMVCSTCCPKLNNKCQKCSLHISSIRCKAIENLLLYTEMSCPNAKYGCKEKIIYTKSRNHEKECIHKPCYCPLLGCHFVASSKVLSNHFSHKHEDRQIKFSYGHSFDISLKTRDKIIVLQEINDDKLFILNNSATKPKNIVLNIFCIGPNSSEFKYSYDILACSQKYTLKLQSFTKNIQQLTSTTFSAEFLVIPFNSSKPHKLEICITPSKVARWELNGHNTIADYDI